jgi:hypothetical protein
MISQDWKTLVSTFLDVQGKDASGGSESGSIKWSQKII